MIKLSIFSLALLYSCVSLATASIHGSGSDGPQGGGDGHNAVNISVTLTEGNEFIEAIGTVGDRSISKSFAKSGEILGLYATGGNGGHGRPGRNGRDGADGFPGRPGVDGRDGSRGRDGRDGTFRQPDGGPGQNGGHGTNGYDGGRGTDGYPGENGTNGGPGGNGGNGGNIVVKSLTTDLWMHVSASYYGGTGGIGGRAGLGGKGGTGGIGGPGGEGGRGGPGGRGGRGYRCTSDEKAKGCRDGSNGRNGYRGSHGRDGNRGWSGSDGRNGSNGRRGSNGWDGDRGSLIFQLVDRHGKVLMQHSSPNIYNLAVESFDVIDGNNDGIFEPGEAYKIANIVVVNRGEIPAPAGATVSFSDGSPVAFGSPALPAISAGETFKLKHTLSGKVPSGRVDYDLQIASQVYFRGLEFKASDYSTELAIQYPIQITGIDYPSHLLHGEKGIATVHLKNISRKAYDDIGLSYSLNGQLDKTVSADVSKLAPGSSAIERLEIIFPTGAADYHQPELVAQAFRGSLNYQRVKITPQVYPKYNYDEKADGVLLVDGQTEHDYALIQDWLKSAHLKFDTYDIKANSGTDLLKVDGYSKKVAFLPSMDSVTSATSFTLELLAKNRTNITTTNLSPISITTPDYKVRSENRVIDFFSLRDDEKVDVLTKSIFGGLDFLKKQDSMKAFLHSGNPLLPSLEAEYIEDLHDEWKLADRSTDVYKKGQPLLQAYATFTTSQHSVVQFMTKSYFAGLLDQLMPLGQDKGRLDSGWNAFLKIVDDIREYNYQLEKLDDSCGEIKGRYMDKGSFSIKFQGRFFGGIQGKTPDDAITLNGKETGDMEWNFSYNFNGNRYKTTAKMTCGSPFITLEMPMPHLGTTLTLYKVSTDGKRPPDNDDDSGWGRK